MMENVKFAVALRGARAMLGWGQQDFADMLSVAKSTVARIETLEMEPKAEFWTRAVRLFKDSGLTVDISGDEGVQLHINEAGLNRFVSGLQEEKAQRPVRSKAVADFKETLVSRGLMKRSATKKKSPKSVA
jgi:DNA-binding XRE family transcriptional regulator